MKADYWVPRLIASFMALGLPCLLLFASDREQQSPGDFVEITEAATGIQVDLPYASEENFCKVKLYPVERCFLRREVADSLIAAHRSLEKEGFGIKIWDGYRPRSVQWKMWEVSPKKGYVGDPVKGSKHNRGAAVDVTLFHLDSGKEAKMPTPYDEFTERAHANYLKVSKAVAKNRKLLQETLRRHGFTTIRTEWWHFNHANWEAYDLEDAPLISLPTSKETE